VKKKLSFFLLIIIAVFFLHGNTKKETSNLPPSYKKWLEEEVVYIIAPIEKEVFLKLKTDSIDFALNLSKTYMALAEYKKVESVLSPFLNQAKPTKYEVFFIMGKAYQNTGELSKAIDVFDKAISRYGLNINLLNSIGECYFQLGEVNEALAAWEKSLEINPNQPQIKKNVEALKEKK